MCMCACVSVCVCVLVCVCVCVCFHGGVFGREDGIVGVCTPVCRCVRYCLCERIKPFCHCFLFIHCFSYYLMLTTENSVHGSRLIIVIWFQCYDIYQTGVLFLTYSRQVCSF